MNNPKRKEGSGSRPHKSGKRPEDEAVSQQTVLHILAKEWDRIGPPGIMDISDIAGQLNSSVEAVRRAIQPLFVMGAVDVDRIGLAAYLTPKGYALYQNESDH